MFYLGETRRVNSLAFARPYIILCEEKLMQDFIHAAVQSKNTVKSNMYKILYTKIDSNEKVVVTRVWPLSLLPFLILCKVKCMGMYKA